MLQSKLGPDPQTTNSGRKKAPFLTGRNLEQGSFDHHSGVPQGSALGPHLFTMYRCINALKTTSLEPQPGDHRSWVLFFLVFVVNRLLFRVMTVFCCWGQLLLSFLPVGPNFTNFHQCERVFVLVIRGSSGCRVQLSPTSVLSRISQW